MDEHWLPIRDFPDYQVSDCGRVYSDKTGTILRPSMNSTGNVKVNLMVHTNMHTRSLRTLVAEAFVSGEEDFDNATPINLDGNHWNNRKENLLWRPRWFGWKYTRQFHEAIPSEYTVPIVDTKHNVAYENVCQAGVTDGVLWEYIYQSILTGRPVFPTGSIYAFV